MQLIQQWNHPSLIYLLIPLMLGMMAYVYHDIWKRLRAYRVCELSKDYIRPSLKKFTLVCAAIVLCELAMVVFAIWILPKNIAFVSFLVVFTLEIVIIYSFKKAVHSYFYTKYIPKDVSANIKNFVITPNKYYYRILPWAFFVIMGLLILAVMGPEGGEKQTMLKRNPLTVTVAFDLSRSMNARDFQPSRLLAAKDEIQTLLSQSAGDEVGLVLFSDTAVIQSPQTQDVQTLLTFLNMADTETLPTHGTDLNKALEMALKTFDEVDDDYYQDTGSKARRVVLITDGENHTGDLDATLERYRERHVHVDVIAVGTENGAEVPDKSGMPLLYRHEPVISRLQTDLLQQIARKTSGTFVRYSTPEMAARSIINTWDAIRVVTKPRGYISSLYRVQLYHIFLYPAFGILILIMLYPSVIMVIDCFRHCKNSRHSEKDKPSEASHD